MAGLADDPPTMSLSDCYDPWLGGGVEQEVEEVLGVRTRHFLDQRKKKRMVSKVIIPVPGGLVEGAIGFVGVAVFVSDY